MRRASTGQRSALRGLHDHWAIYRNDTWQPRHAEGFEHSRSIQLIETAGHTPQDVTTLVRTAHGTAALTHPR